MRILWTKTYLEVMEKMALSLNNMEMTLKIIAKHHKTIRRKKRIHTSHHLVFARAKELEVILI